MLPQKSPKPYTPEAPVDSKILQALSPKPSAVKFMKLSHEAFEGHTQPAWHVSRGSGNLAPTVHIFGSFRQGFSLKVATKGKFGFGCRIQYVKDALRSLVLYWVHGSALRVSNGFTVW